MCAPHGREMDDARGNTTRRKFRSGDREVMQASPNFTRKSLTKVVKALVQDEDQEGMNQSLQALPKQGHMSRCTDEDGAAVWGKPFSAWVMSTSNLP